MRQLSKSRFTSGLQCHKLLWWKAYEPDAPELVPGAEKQAIFDMGHFVGALAREHVPGGVLIDAPHHDYGARLGATKRAIENGARVIYEAAFSRGNVFVAVDILERTSRTWRMIEVKASSSVKEQHVPDVAIQLHVLRAAGLDVTSAEVMHLNRECVYPALGNLFTRTNVTREAEAMLDDLPREVAEQLAVLKGTLPDVPIGPHCETPYGCPFKTRCWPALPPHHVSTLHNIGIRKWWPLVESGVDTIERLPADFKLGAPAKRQVRAIRDGRMVVESSLGKALAELREPISILDFEAVAPSVPVWSGCHPFDQVPVQFSAHVREGRTRWTHHEWLAEGPGDPREELVRRLAAAIGTTGTVLVYSSAFEKLCLRLIAEARPELAGPITNIMERIADALPLVRDHVYHPDFAGSFSLKDVLPVLVPGMSYEGLEIGEGQSAQRELERMLLGDDDPPASQVERLREALLRYCEMDTWGVVRLFERLHELAGEA